MVMLTQDSRESMGKDTHCDPLLVKGPDGVAIKDAAKVI
jgi:hypothetical protein